MPLRLSAERDECHLGRGSDAHGHGAAQSDVDVERLVSLAIEPVAFGVDEAAGREAQDAALHGMGVTTEGEVDVGAPQDLGPPV